MSPRPLPLDLRRVAVVLTCPDCGGPVVARPSGPAACLVDSAGGSVMRAKQRPTRVPLDLAPVGLLSSGGPGEGGLRLLLHPLTLAVALRPVLVDLLAQKLDTGAILLHLAVGLSNGRTCPV
jgi:hypothetical protein